MALPKATQEAGSIIAVMYRMRLTVAINHIIAKNPRTFYDAPEPRNRQKGGKAYLQKHRNTLHTTHTHSCQVRHSLSSPPEVPRTSASHKKNGGHSGLRLSRKQSSRPS
jgi:hypothetical protein